MNPPSIRLEQTRQQDLEAELQSAQQRATQQIEGVRDFESPEALIGWDRSQTSVPVPLRSRVAASLAQTHGATPQEEVGSKPWWRRLF